MRPCSTSNTTQVESEVEPHRYPGREPTIRLHLRPVSETVQDPTPSSSSEVAPPILITRDSERAAAPAPKGRVVTFAEGTNFEPSAFRVPCCVHPKFYKQPTAGPHDHHQHDHHHHHHDHDHDDKPDET